MQKYFDQGLLGRIAKFTVFGAITYFIFITLTDSILGVENPEDILPNALKNAGLFGSAYGVFMAFYLRPKEMVLEASPDDLSAEELKGMMQELGYLLKNEENKEEGPSWHFVPKRKPAVFSADVFIYFVDEKLVFKGNMFFLRRLKPLINQGY